MPLWRALAAFTLVPIVSYADSLQSTRAITPDEVATAQRIVFCSGHPAVTIDHLRAAVVHQAAEGRWARRPEIVPGESLQANDRPSGAYFVIVEDEVIEPPMRECIARFPGAPGATLEALQGVVDRLGKSLERPPMPGLGPIAGAGLTRRGDDWIESIDAIAFKGVDALVPVLRSILALE